MIVRVKNAKFLFTNEEFIFDLVSIVSMFVSNSIRAGIMTWLVRISIRGNKY